MNTEKNTGEAFLPGHTPPPWKFLKQDAKGLGLCAVGVARAKQVPKVSMYTFDNWLRNGAHSGMNYMERWKEQRFDPRHLGVVAGADVVICVAMPYGEGAAKGGLWDYVSNHARGIDYHTTLKKKLRVLQEKIREQFPDARSRCFVDSGPILERTWAMIAGVGTIGKSGMLIVPGTGPSVVLGEIVCAAVPIPTFSASLSPQFKDCLECRRCIDACPTGAIIKPGIVDARRCLAYHSIENQTSKVDAEISDSMRLVFGCDECVSVCPQQSDTAFSCLEPLPTEGLCNVTLRSIVTMNTEKFQQQLKGTGLARTGAKTIQRNARLILRHTRS